MTSNKGNLGHGQLDDSCKGKSFEEMLRDSSCEDGGVDLTWLYEALAEKRSVNSVDHAEVPLVPENPALAFSSRAYGGRPVERIPAFLERLGEVWSSSFPDWRFGQLMCNLDRAYRASHNDMDFFYLEEDEFLAFLKEFANR